MTLETTSLLVAMLRDTDGVEVVYGGESSYGHFESEGEVVLAEDGRGGVIATDPSVVIATGIFATPLAVEGMITVDGDAYTIRRHHPFEDGKLTRIWLEEL